MYEISGLVRARVRREIESCVRIAAALGFEQGPMNCLFGIEAREARDTKELIKLLSSVPTASYASYHRLEGSLTREAVTARCDLITAIHARLVLLWPDPRQLREELKKPCRNIGDLKPKNLMAYGGLKGLQQVAERFGAVRKS